MRNSGRRTLLTLAAATLAWTVGLPAALAATRDVPAQAGALAAMVAKAQPGDILRLAPGRHDGPVSLDKSLTLDGLPGAELIGSGQGSVLSVRAADVTIRGLTIRGSGTRPIDFDSGIYVEKGADGFTAESNLLDGNLFGIVLHGPHRSLVRGNRIANRTDRYDTERGNGIHMWAVRDSVIEGNAITGGRDGIFLESSHGNLLQDNRLTQVRFAIHYMYSNGGRLIGNVSQSNRVGFALMYSTKLTVLRNVSLDDQEHGLMLHSGHGSEMAENLVRGTAEKCGFLYTTSNAVIRDNRFENCGIGLHFTGGSEKNAVYGNAFINSRTQVKYSGTTIYEWSKGGHGNYWSDNPAVDLNGDGIADTAFRPNTLMDRVLWKYPLAKMLLSSPAMETLRFAQSQFPALFPGGVVDSHPLMKPIALPIPAPKQIEPTS